MSAGSLNSTVLAPLELSAEDIACWRGFMAADRTAATPFLSFAYASAAQTAFGHARICRLESTRGTEAFFPFQFRSAAHRIFGIAERLGGELSDAFGLVSRADFSIKPEGLLRSCRLNALYFTHLEESQRRLGLDGEEPRAGLRIDCPDGGPAFWEARRIQDRKFVADTERRERKLTETHGPLRFVFSESLSGAGLETLIQAKRAQYAQTGVPDVLAPPARRRFLAVLAQAHDPECRAILSTLHAGEQWIASHFGLMSGTVLHYWFPVYAPAMKPFAPGRLLVKAIIDHAAENALSAIDRGEGESEAKTDFATARRLYLRGVWQRPGPVSLAYRAGLSLGWRLAGARTGARTGASAGTGTREKFADR